MRIQIIFCFPFNVFSSALCLGFSLSLLIDVSRCLFNSSIMVGSVSTNNHYWFDFAEDTVSLDDSVSVTLRSKLFVCHDFDFVYK